MARIPEKSKDENMASLERSIQVDLCMEVQKSLMVFPNY